MTSPALIVHAWLLISFLCNMQHVSAQINKTGTDWQAHRGGRGLYPENTIVAMKNAIDLNVTTLELDVHITLDKQVVVSHDPYFNDVITTTPSGGFIAKSDVSSYLLYGMTYDSIRTYDVGLKPHPDFPRQKKVAAYKPLLSVLIDSCEAYAVKSGKKMRYNIEIKSTKNTDNTRHPAPKEFTDLVMNVITSKKITDRVTIQCFDVRPLQYLHAQKAHVKLAFLVEKNADKLSAQLNTLGFTPDIYSPQFKYAGKNLIRQCHQKHMQVIPWTVNTPEAIKQLLDDGADGIISDYPDLF